MDIDPVVVARARDLINEYDELITRMKIFKEKIRESPDLFTELSSILFNIYNKTRDLMEVCNSVDLDLGEEYSRYLKTYCEYLVLISIPYVLEILNNMKNYASDKLRNSIDKYVKLFNGLIIE